MERIGKLPMQASSIQINLLEKPGPAGGFRPIGIYHMLYRLWGKLRGDLLREWEKKQHLDLFAASAGYSTIDVVWKHSVMAQFAVNSGMECVSLLWDLSKCYEHFDHALLKGRAKAMGYPRTVLG